MIEAITKSLQEFTIDLQDKGFSEVVSGARKSVGLAQYKTAEYLRMPLARLKLLEQGKFKTNPTDDELRRLSGFYGVPESLLEEKAKKQLAEKKGLR
jgi:transcriptional regulator with XRE-family HTH domain